MKFDCLLLTLATLIGSIAVAQAQELSIGSETISTGGVATVDLNISGLSPGSSALGTFDVNVGFNSSILNFASATYGDPVLGDLLNNNGLAINTTTPGSGTTELFELSLDDPGTLLAAQPSSFTIAQLTFDGVSSGTSALSLSINAIGDQNGNSLNTTLSDGSISVKATGGSGGTVSAPEIHASAAVSGLILLLGGVAVMRGRP
jgi:hypothetical protein